MQSKTVELRTKCKTNSNRLFIFIFSDPHLIEKQCAQKGGQEGQLSFQLDSNAQMERGQKRNYFLQLSAFTPMSVLKEESNTLFRLFVLLRVFGRSAVVTIEASQKLFAKQTARNISHTASQRV